MSPDDSLRLVGTIVAEKYRVESLVAEGGFALLYRATHQIWKRPVALKVFKVLGERSRANKEELVGSFIREGALLADLSERSASICQARDVGMLVTEAGATIPFMVLEWLEGKTLEDVLKAEQASHVAPRTLQETMNLVGPIGEALALAHTLGVVHRDVKPANIFLLGDPRAPGCPVKLLDFGIAKVVMDAQKAEGAFADTTGDVTAFTPSYAAPEQFSRKHGSTGPWTDTFALALILVECISGKMALAGDDFLQIAYTATNPAARPTPRALGAVVPDEVEAVFERALAVTTTARYGTVGEFWNALRVAMGEDPMTLAAPSSSWLGVLSSSRRSAVPAPSSRGLASAPGTPAPVSLAPTPRSSGPVLLGPVSSPAISLAPAAPRIPQPMPVRADRRTAVALSLFGALTTSAVVGGVVIVGLRSWHSAPPALPAPIVSASAAPSATAPPPPRCPPDMAYVPGGQFFMGSDDGTPMEKPAHNVKVSPYCIDIYEVTTKKYVACSDSGKCKRANRGNEWDGITPDDRKKFYSLCNITDPTGRPEEPINCIDWERADAFCRAGGGRLPTEAEWEFAARGSDGRLYPWGDDPPSAKYLNACGPECVAWGKAHGVPEKAMYPSDDGFATTSPVGSFPAGKSRFGLMDVVGNVWEWVGDWYAPYTSDSLVDPKGPPTGTRRVMRGGAWNGAEPSWVRPSFRYMNDPASSSYGVGFRCAADVK